jgi:nucleoside-diphosphate-sugar epimerase
MALSLENRTALVTGASGFVGSTLATELANRGATVRALVRSPTKASYLRDVHRVEIVVGDIRDAARMRELSIGSDWVFGVAALMRGSHDQQHEVNVEGTRSLVEAAASAGVGRYVHVSTLSVYGSGRHGSITEDMGPAPARDPYSVTKAKAEEVVREVGGVCKLSYSILRCGNMYGPRSEFWAAGMMKLARRKPTVYIGNGSGTCPAIHIDDITDLLIMLATHPAADGEAFNGAPDPPPTWREFIGGYQKLAGHQQWIGLPLVFFKILTKLIALLSPTASMGKEAPHILEFFTSSDASWSMGKARRLLGWQARIGLEEGIERCAPWLRAQGLLRDSTRE